MENKISIIVPFYNCAATLSRCIESVLAQTYKNFELILVSDRGNDGSYDIAKEYEKKDGRIKVYDKKHGGVSYTRNYGLKRAGGNYIQFLDSDDYIEPNMLEIMMGKALEYDAELVVCNYDHPIMKNYLGNCVLDLSKKEDLIKYAQATFAVVVPWNKLWKRSCITRYFDETVKLAEDDLFDLVNLENVKTVVSIDEVLYHYYIPTVEEGGGTIGTMAKTKFWENKSSFYYLRKMLYKRSLKDMKEYMVKKDAKEVAYARVFDFMIWEFLLYKGMGADDVRDGLRKEIQNVFNDKGFKKSLKIRKEYGVKFKYNPKKDDYQLVNEFVDKCYEILEDPNTSDMKQFYLMLNLFVKMFIVVKGEISNGDIISNTALDLQNNATEEAKYINKIYK